MRIQDDIDEMGGGLTDMYQPKSSGKGNGRSAMSKLSKKETDEERHQDQSDRSAINNSAETWYVPGDSGIRPVQPSQKILMIKNELPSMTPSGKLGRLPR